MPVSYRHSQIAHATEERVIKAEVIEPVTAETILDELTEEVAAIYAKALDALKYNSAEFRRKKLKNRIPAYLHEKYLDKIRTRLWAMDIRKDLLKRQDIDKWAEEEYLIRLAEAGIGEGM